MSVDVVQLASQGQLDQLVSIVSRDKTRLQITDKRGRGLLHHAAHNGHIHIMEYLLAQGTGTASS